MVTPGDSHKGHSTPQVRRRRWRFGWWGPLFGLVLVVGGGHLLVLISRIFGETPQREFSLSGFALTWIWMAACASLLQWWERRKESRQGDAPPRPKWRADTPRWLVIVLAATSVSFLATWFAGYLAAMDGEISILWADALVAFAFALAVIVRRLGESFSMPEDQEAGT